MKWVLFWYEVKALGGGGGAWIIVWLAYGGFRAVLTLELIWPTTKGDSFENSAWCSVYYMSFPLAGANVNPSQACMSSRNSFGLLLVVVVFPLSCSFTSCRHRSVFTPRLQELSLSIFPPLSLWRPLSLFICPIDSGCLGLPRLWDLTLTFSKSCCLLLDSPSLCSRLKTALSE